MAKNVKEIAVKEITKDFEESPAAVLTEYRGLTVEQLKELRRSMGPDTKYAVVKNTLTEIAAKNAGVDAFEGLLNGPTAIAFIRGDAVAVAKSLTDFAKDHEKLIIKGGYYEGQKMDAEQIKDLAALESVEHQLALVAGVLKAPASAAARITDALRLKREEAGETAEAPAAE